VSSVVIVHHQRQLQPTTAAAAHFHVACCCRVSLGSIGLLVAGRWLLVAICCLPKRMVAMAPLQIFEASILFRVSVSQITRRFASGVVRLWVTTIAEILQKIYILEGIAQKKGETRVASSFVVLEPVIQNKIWGLFGYTNSMKYKKDP